jgi:integrase
MAKKKKSQKPHKTRRASGTGALFFSEARGVWVGRVRVGQKTDGSPRYAERSHAEQAKVVEALKLVEPPGDRTTVAELAKRWLADMRVRDRTADIRRNSVEKHINPVLGGAPVVSLSAGQIEQAARKWGDALGSVNTVRLVLEHLSTLLQEAVRFGLRPDNPCRAAKKPKGVKKRIDPFTKDELLKVIECGATLPRGRVASILAGTGMRVGEALALDIADYDPAASTLSITKTLSIRNTLGPPKSAAGNRVVDVPEVCKPVLAAAVAGRKSAPLFASRTGRRLTHDGASRAFDVIQKRLGLRRRNLHQLRHSWASHAHAEGYSIGDCAAWIGDTPATFLKTYCHPTGAPMRAANAALFGGASGGTKVGAGESPTPK